MQPTVMPAKNLSLCLTSLCLAVLAACTSGGSGEPTAISSALTQGSPRPTLTLGPVQASTFLLVDTPDLTAEQSQEMRDIILKDPVVVDLAMGSDVSISKVGGSFFGKDPQSGKWMLIGATAHLTLSPPANHDRITLPTAGRRPYYNEWPHDLQAKYSPYTEALRHYRVENLSEFDIEVDLHSRSVVDVEAGFAVLDSEQKMKLLDATPSFDTSPGPDSARARSIAENDPAVTAGLSGAGLSGCLTFQLGQHRFASCLGHWDAARDVAGDWPEVIDQDPTTGDYRSEIIHAAQDGASALTVFVDLDSGKVIGITAQFRD